VATDIFKSLFNPLFAMEVRIPEEVTLCYYDVSEPTSGRYGPGNTLPARHAALIADGLFASINLDALVGGSNASGRLLRVVRGQSAGDNAYVARSRATQELTVVVSHEVIDWLALFGEDSKKAGLPPVEFVDVLTKILDKHF
jgi:hypothetical protein